MSQLYVDNIKNRTGGAISAPSGINVTGHSETDTLNVSGITTLGITSVSQLNVSGVSTFHNNVHLDNNDRIIFGENNDLKIWHSGNDSYIQDAGTGSLILSTDSLEVKHSGLNSTLLTATNGGAVDLYHNNSKKFETTTIGIAVSGIVTATSGIVTYYGDGSNLTGIEVGLATEALVANNSIVTLDLTKQDHKITATGICTITVTGGTEADSHTVRLINSGIATVGFSTYFLFPSGATPSLPEADGSISLISFTVNRVGAAGTQLLTGASLNYS